MTSPAPEQAPAAVAPRWALPDALWCWLAGFAGAVVGSVVAAVAGADVTSTAVLFGLEVPGQYLAIVAVAALVSRAKGTGSMAHDFGWRLRGSQAGALIVGAALQFGLLYLIAPIARLAHLHHEPQELVRRARDTSSPALLVLIVITTSVLAPAVEELVFRGVLLRALLRRTTDGWAITVSAFVFALVHLIDPGARFVFPGLFGLGLVLGILAVRDRSLSRPMYVHAGFNLVATLLTIATH